jgi:hypothetical protein
MLLLHSVLPISMQMNGRKKKRWYSSVVTWMDDWWTVQRQKKLATLPSREVLLAKLLGSMMSPLSGLARFFDAAKKDLEAKSLTKVGDLVGSAPAKKEDAPAPVAEVAPVETPVAEAAPVEAVAETPVEPVAEVPVETTPEVAQAEEAPKTEETPAV